MAGAIASRVSGLSVVVSKSSSARNFLARVKWLPVTSCLYGRMHGEISIMSVKTHLHKIDGLSGDGSAKKDPN